MDAADPAPGAGFWYLVRASNAFGGGTYDEASAGLAATRDAEIDGAAAACP